MAWYKHGTAWYKTQEKDSYFDCTNRQPQLLGQSRTPIILQHIVRVPSIDTIHASNDGQKYLSTSLCLHCKETT